MLIDIIRVTFDLLLQSVPEAHYGTSSVQKSCEIQLLGVLIGVKVPVNKSVRGYLFPIQKTSLKDTVGHDQYFLVLHFTILNRI